MAKPSDLPFPRLGVVVGKKVARRAVARNYMKRVVRDTFRLNRPEIANLDIVARVHTPFEQKDYTAVREELQRLLTGLKKCLEHSSS
jgi:ribonuclease P protein component